MIGFDKPTNGIWWIVSSSLDSTLGLDKPTNGSAEAREWIRRAASTNPPTVVGGSLVPAYDRQNLRVRESHQRLLVDL